MIWLYKTPNYLPNSLLIYLDCYATGLVKKKNTYTTQRRKRKRKERKGGVETNRERHWSGFVTGRVTSQTVIVE